MSGLIVPCQLYLRDGYVEILPDIPSVSGGLEVRTVGQIAEHCLSAAQLEQLRSREHGLRGQLRLTVSDGR